MPPGGVLKTFDAFPKVTSTYSVRSSEGGFTTIVLAVICVVISWVYFAEYIDGMEHMSFHVDPTIQHQFQVNLDVTVHMPCEAISVTAADNSRDFTLLDRVIELEDVVMDVSQDQSINSNEKKDIFNHIYKQAKRRSKWKATTRQRKDKNKAPDACRVYGSFPMNRVRGIVQILAKGYGGYPERRVLQPDQFNFTHYIDELSFGDFYHEIVNPLDGVLAVATEKVPFYQYFLSIVPTTYARVNSDGSVRSQIQTNQYAVTEQTRMATHVRGHPPGIFFHYDIEPLALFVEKSRMSFSTFLIRLINIVGGVVVCTSKLFTLVRYLVHRRSRQQNGTVLDMPNYKREEKDSSLADKFQQ